MKCKNALSKSAADWKDGKVFIAHKTELNADENGLRLEWKAKQNNLPRYIHLAYVGVAELASANPTQVLIFSNRADVSGCVEQHDKSCKHPESGNPAKRRERPLWVTLESPEAAKAFAESLMKLADVQRKIAPLPGADVTMPWREKSKKKSEKAAGRLTV